MVNKISSLLILAIIIIALLIIVLVGNAVFNPTVAIILRNDSSEPLSDVQIKVSGQVAAVNNLPSSKHFSATFRSIHDSGIQISFSRLNQPYSISYGYVTNGANEKHTIVIPAPMKEAQVHMAGIHWGIPPYSARQESVPLRPAPTALP